MKTIGAAPALLLLTSGLVTDSIAAPAPAVSNVPAIKIGLVMQTGTTRNLEMKVVRNELETVWAPYGVKVTWYDSVTDAARSTLTVSVFITTKAPPGASPSAGRLGAVVRIGNVFRPRIDVVGPNVENLVRATSDAPVWSGIFMRLYSRMIARVIAHEMGHLLLESNEHSPTGLLRASFGERDVRSTSARDFALSDTEVGRLAPWRRDGGVLSARRSDTDAVPVGAAAREPQSDVALARDAGGVRPTHCW